MLKSGILGYTLAATKVEHDWCIEITKPFFSSSIIIVAAFTALFSVNLYSGQHCFELHYGVIVVVHCNYEYIVYLNIGAASVQLL